MGEHPAASPVTRAAHQAWIRRYARILLVLGGVYLVFVAASARTLGVGALDVAVAVLYAGFVAAVVSKAPPSWMAFYILAGFAAAEVLALLHTGFSGSSSLLLCTLPLLAAVFAGTRTAYAAMGGGMIAYAIVGVMRLRGGIGLPVSATLLDPTVLANWLGMAAVFAAVVAPAVWLVGQLMTDLGASLRDLDRARAHHEAQVQLRVAAEEGLRIAVDRRERARHHEAEGLLIGGVAHDVRNALSILRLWSGTLATDATLDPEIRETATRIDRTCAETADVTERLLALARPPPEVREGHVAPAVEAAASVLREMLPEDVRFASRSDETGAVAFDPSTLQAVIIALAAGAQWEGLSGVGLMVRKPSEDEITAMPRAGSVIEMAFEGDAPLKAFDPGFADEIGEEGGLLIVEPEHHGSSGRGRVRLLLASASAPAVGSGTATREVTPP